MVSLIILTYNRLDVTKDCLESIRRHTPQPHEIIIVDNGSSDGSRQWLRERQSEQPTIKLIENSENLGFSAGCNQGIRAASGEYLLLLNNDTVVTPGWLAGLLEPFSDPSVGVVGPITNNLSGAQEWPWSDYNGLGELDDFALHHRSKYRYWWIPSRRIVGFCMLFRRSLVEQIGYLDERFGSGNYEDDDFCLRTALAGYRNLVLADVFIHHVGSATFSGNNLNYTEAMLKNRALFNEKWSKPVVNKAEAARIIYLKTMEKADELCQQGQQNQAVELILQEGIAQLPEEAGFYHALAKIFLAAEMPQEAFDLLKEAPASATTSLLLSRSLLGLDRLEEAVTEFEKASDAQPAEHLLVRGLLFAKLGQKEEAKQFLQQSLKLYPACAETLSALAELYFQDADQDAAMAMLIQAVANNGSENALASYHQQLQTEADFAAAEQLYCKLRHFYPYFKMLASLHVDLLLKLGKDADAILIIEKMLASGEQPQGFLEAALAVRSRVGVRKPATKRIKKGVAVTLSMIVKNEEKNLAKCLASVVPLVDEIIVVDTGSTDKTREIATVFGAIVKEMPWKNDFATARNFAIEKAKGNWILSLDADEVISRLDYQLFNGLIDRAAGKKVAYAITTRNYVTKINLENWQANRGEYPAEEAGRGWTPSGKVRLFPNHPKIRFKNPVHEMIEPALEKLKIPAIDCPVVVHHYGYLDEKRQSEKKEYYYELGKKKLAQSGFAPVAIVELAIQAAELKYFDEAIDLWQKALQTDPDSYLAWFNIGYSYLEKGMFKDALDAGCKALKLRDNYREAAVNVAICQMALGEFAAAQQLLERFIPENSDYPTLSLLEGFLMVLGNEQSKGLQQLKDLRDSNIEFGGFVHQVVTKMAQGGQQQSARRLVKVLSRDSFCNPETVDFIEGLFLPDQG